MDKKHLIKVFGIALLLFLVGAVLTQAFLALAVNTDQSRLLQKLHDEKIEFELQFSATKTKLTEIEAERLQWQSKLDDTQTSINTIEQEIHAVINGNEAKLGNFKASGGGLDNFLQVNGAEFVKEAGDMFRAAGLLHDIKPEVLVCIAQADSSLGNNLKSTNNIGNVGNTDSGSVKHYNSLGQAINGIGATLNNQYLKGDTIIGQLSRGGRTMLGTTKYGCSNAPSPFKCYASSPVNWNRNVKTCLQDIFQDPSIDESFKFRS